MRYLIMVNIPAYSERIKKNVQRQHGLMMLVAQCLRLGCKAYQDAIFNCFTVHLLLPE